MAILKLKGDDGLLIPNYHGYGGYCYRITPNSKRNIGYFNVINCGDRNEIWNLRIIESKQNKGYGTRMLQEFLQEYNANKPLFLHVYKNNAAAIRLYEKVGFVIVKERHEYAWTMQYKSKEVR